MQDSLGDRMKEYYENRAKTKLTRRIPVIIRLDGKSFHTLTRNFVKPFDRVLIETMQETMQYLCESIQGCVLGYTQSDEITLVLIDYQTLSTEAWFDYEVQKLCSVSASLATLAFNGIFVRKFHKYEASLDEDIRITYSKAIDRAVFDSRCFNIPREEVTNCILWRQKDATRNSIQMAGQAYFSHRELQGLSCSQIQEKLFSEKGINWDKFPDDCKRGSCCIKVSEALPDGNVKSYWTIDREIPIFTGDGRKYIENVINYEV